MKRLSLILLLALASPAWADPMKDALAADDKGDYATELRIVRPLAKSGAAWAQAQLGYMSGLGLGLVQDQPETVKWYRLAAAQGNAVAQVNLGVTYAIGEGVLQDVVRAHMWFNLAAVSGNEDAVKGRDLAASHMTPQQIGEAQKLARECQARQFKGCE